MPPDHCRGAPRARPAKPPYYRPQAHPQEPIDGTGRPCRGLRFVAGPSARAHGRRAPQVRDAERLRLALLLDPALKGLSEIIKDIDHPQRLGAIKEMLARKERDVQTRIRTNQWRQPETLPAMDG